MCVCDLSNRSQSLFIDSKLNAAFLNLIVLEFCGKEITRMKVINDFINFHRISLYDIFNTLFSVYFSLMSVQTTTYVDRSTKSIIISSIFLFTVNGNLLSNMC